MLILAISLDAAVRRDRSISSPLILTIVASGTGAALMLSGSMLLGQLAMILAAALGAILAAAFLLPRAVEGRGVVPVAVAMLASLWLSGYFYSELPIASALLLAAASFPALFMISLSERLSSWRAVLMRAGIVIIPVAISVLLAFLASPSLDY